MTTKRIIERRLASAFGSSADADVGADPVSCVSLEAVARPQILESMENGWVTYNHSAPPVAVTPVLTYPNVIEAVAWLVRVFGFHERVRIGDHRAQLSFGDGALIVADDTSGRRSPSVDAGFTHSVMVRVDDIDKHYAQVHAAGVVTAGEPTDMSYGERQYSVTDPAGHRWTFTQSVRDVAPEDWGGQTIKSW